MPNMPTWGLKIYMDHPGLCVTKTWPKPRGLSVKNEQVGPKMPMYSGHTYSTSVHLLGWLILNVLLYIMIYRYSTTVGCDHQAQSNGINQFYFWQHFLADLGTHPFWHLTKLQSRLLIESAFKLIECVGFKWVFWENSFKATPWQVPWQ